VTTPWGHTRQNRDNTLGAYALKLSLEMGYGALSMLDWPNFAVSTDDVKAT